MAKPCVGVTMFIRFTMLGDEVRRCETCGQEYLTRVPEGRYNRPLRKGASASLFRCGLLAARSTKVGAK